MSRPELFLREIKRLYSRYGTSDSFISMFNNLEQPQEFRDQIGISDSQTVVRAIRSSIGFQDISVEEFIKKIKTVKAENMIIPFLKRVNIAFNDSEKFGKFLKKEMMERIGNHEKLRTIYSLTRGLENSKLGSIVGDKLKNTENSANEEVFYDEIIEALEKSKAA